MELFLKFSGLGAMAVAWLFVVAPAVRYGINFKNETITIATIKSKRVMDIVSRGLVIGSILQGLFLFYLLNRFSLHLTDIGSLLYLSANLATILVAIFHYDKYPHVHDLFSYYYFIVCPISLAFIGYSLFPTYFVVSIFSFLLILLFGSASLWLIATVNAKNALLELWIFFILSIWTTVMTVI